MRGLPIIKYNNNESKRQDMKLFLDDFRNPQEIIWTFDGMYNEFPDFRNEEWLIARNYTEFKTIFQMGWKSIKYISFDHDLNPGHYHKNIVNGKLNYNSPDFDNDDNKTGWHCAKWLKEFCIRERIDLPNWNIHSQNEEGGENIKALLT